MGDTNNNNKCAAGDLWEESNDASADGNKHHAMRVVLKSEMIREDYAEKSLWTRHCEEGQCTTEPKEGETSRHSSRLSFNAFELAKIFL